MMTSGPAAEKNFQGLLGSGGAGNGEARFAQHSFANAQLSQIVVDEKNLRHETSI